MRKAKVDIFKELEIKSKVRLMWKNQPMEDCVTLRALGITDDTTIQMIVEPDTQIKLRIQTLKKGTVSVQLNNSSTLKDLVKKLSATTVTSTARINDFYFEQVHLSDENLPFHFYGIGNGATIIQKYEGSFNIRLDSAREHIVLKYITVRATDTIEDLGEKVLECVNASEEGDVLSKDDIVIFRKQKGLGVRFYHELDRDALTLDQCGIKPLDTIIFIRYDGEDCNGIGIPIKDSAGRQRRRHIYGLYDMETVQSLKLKIQHQLHIPHEKQVLEVDGESRHLSEIVHEEEFDEITLEVVD